MPIAATAIRAAKPSSSTWGSTCRLATVPATAAAIPATPNAMPVRQRTCPERA
jgi:hypothetical protein